MPIIYEYTASSSSSTLADTVTIENSGGDGIILPAGHAYWDVDSAATVYAAIGIYIAGPLDGATNQSSGYVNVTGVAAFLAAADSSLVNYGTIVSKETGVSITNGSTLNNAGAGLIDAGSNGTGVVFGQNVYTGTNSVLLNQGTIIGEVGVSISSSSKAAGTIINSGVIESTSGTTGQAIQLGGDDLLELRPTSTIIGTASAISGTLALYGLSGTLAIASNIGSAFTGFDTISIQNSSSWDISGSADGLASGEDILNFGPGDQITLTGIGNTGSSPTYQFGSGGLTVGSSTIDIQSPYLSAGDFEVSGTLGSVTIAVRPLTGVVTIDVNALTGIDTTGTADDTTLINNAINAVPVGYTIDLDFGPGTFAIDGTVMLRSDTDVMGSGSTILAVSQLQILGTQAQFENQDFTGSGSQVNSSISIRGLTFTYPQPLWDIAIWFQNVTNIEISGNTFLAANNGDIALLNAINSVISGNVADGNINGAFNGWNGLSNIAIVNNSDYQSGSAAGSGGYWFNGTYEPNLGNVYSGGNLLGSQYNNYAVENINAGVVPGGTGFGFGSLGYGQTSDNYSDLEGNLYAVNGTPSTWGFLNKGTGVDNTMQGNIVSQYVAGNPEDTSAFVFNGSGSGSLAAVGNAIIGNEVFGSTETYSDFQNQGDSATTSNDAVIDGINPLEFTPLVGVDDPTGASPIVSGVGGSIGFGTIASGPIATGLTIAGTDNLTVEPTLATTLSDILVFGAGSLANEIVTLEISAIFGTLTGLGEIGQTIVLSGDFSQINSMLENVEYTSNPGGWDDDIHFSVMDSFGNNAVWDVAVGVEMPSTFGGDGIGTFSSVNSTNYQSPAQLLDGPAPTPLGGDTLVVQGGGHDVTMGGLVTMVLTGSGSNTIIGGNGPGYIQTDTGPVEINLAQGGDITVSGGSGGINVNALSGDDLIQSASGPIQAVLGNGADTVLGGIDGANVTGGGGQALVTTLPQDAGPLNVVLGTGGGIVYALSGSAILRTSAGALDTIYAGQGTVNLFSAGFDEIYAGSGEFSVQGSASASDTVIGGSGSLYVQAGGETSYVAPGSGGTEIVAGSGNLIVAPTGDFLLTINSLAGGSRTIALNGAGVVEVDGFGSYAINSQSLSAGIPTIGLTDGTKILMTDATGEFATVSLGTLMSTGWSIAGIGSAQIISGSAANTLVVDGPSLTLSGTLGTGSPSVLDVIAGSQVVLDNLTAANEFNEFTVSGNLADVYGNLAVAQIDLTGGQFQIDPATVTTTGITGTGAVTIDANTSLGVSGSIENGVTISFDGADGSLGIGTLGNLAGTIDGFSATDNIEFYSSGTFTETFASNPDGAGILSIFEAGSILGTVTFGDGSFSSSSFILDSLGNGIEKIAVACFVAGTPIRTPEGDRLIEDLSIGELVTTHDGRAVPIKWIARRRILDGVSRGDFPVLFPKGSLDRTLPTSDFAISSDHALLIGGLLIPAGLLCNGHIAQIDPGDTLSYFHIETEAHEIILAAGVAVETFIDLHNRSGFDNVGEYIARYGNGLTAPATEVAPRVMAGEIASSAIISTFGATFFSSANVSLECQVRGHLDEATIAQVKGWALASNAPAIVEISVNGRIRGYVNASDFRSDLYDAGIGDGWAAFCFQFEPPLPSNLSHTISTRVLGKKWDLDRSPTFLSATSDSSHDVSSLGLIGVAEAAVESARMSILKVRGDSRPVALVIDDGEPDPNRDAGSEAILCHMATLSKIGYRVLFVASRGVTSPLAVRAIQYAGAQPVTAAGGRAIETILDNFPIDVAFIHRPIVAVSYAGLIRTRSPNCKIVMSVADLEHLRFESLLRVVQLQRYEDDRQRSWRRLDQAMHLVDQVITHSTTEKAWLRLHYPNVRSDVLLWTPGVRRIEMSFQSRNGTGFVGSMGHAPNLDAVMWIDRMIEPALRKRGVDFDVSLVGSRFPESFYLLERPGLNCRGEVPDLAAFLGELRVTVAPLRCGAGIKGKVLSSLQAGVPCVMSSVAADGLDLPPELMRYISDDADGIASRIIEIHESQEVFERVALAGITWADEYLAPETIRRQMEAALFDADKFDISTAASIPFNIPTRKSKVAIRKTDDRLRDRQVAFG
jgi:hypothetical protein